MRHVLFAQFFRGVVFLRIIIAVWHSQSILKRLTDDHRAVLVVLAGSKTEKRSDSEGVEVRDCFQHIVAILDRVDALEFLIERLSFRGVDGFLIHPARVIIGDLLDFGRKFRIAV